jgi:deoxyribodipyrimidine photo-lyase
MKQLNDTGYMHNRLRMIVSSFLCKTLLIDYRVGEEYFALKLLDFDLSANNGGWQWAASTGVDNVNYIRIFNPTKQSEKYDAEARFIKKQLPILKNVPAKYLHEPWIYEEELKEYGVILGKNYPRPIVNYEEKRKEALKMYEEINKLN